MPREACMCLANSFVIQARYMQAVHVCCSSSLSAALTPSSKFKCMLRKLGIQRQRGMCLTNLIQHGRHRMPDATISWLLASSNTREHLGRCKDFCRCLLPSQPGEGCKRPCAVINAGKPRQAAMRSHKTPTSCGAKSDKQSLQMPVAHLRCRGPTMHTEFRFQSLEIFLRKHAEPEDYQASTGCVSGWFRLMLV